MKTNKRRKRLTMAKKLALERKAHATTKACLESARHELHNLQQMTNTVEWQDHATKQIVHRGLLRSFQKVLVRQVNLTDLKDFPFNQSFEDALFEQVQPARGILRETKETASPDNYDEFQA